MILTLHLMYLSQRMKEKWRRALRAPHSSGIQHLSPFSQGTTGPTFVQSATPRLFFFYICRSPQASPRVSQALSTPKPPSPPIIAKPKVRSPSSFPRTVPDFFPFSAIVLNRGEPVGLSFIITPRLPRGYISPRSPRLAAGNFFFLISMGTVKTTTRMSTKEESRLLSPSEAISPGMELR